MAGERQPFEWSARYALGDDRLDGEHRHFFLLLAELRQAVEAGRGEEVLTKLHAALRDYARLHFRAEEAWLAQAGYPGLQQQIREHGSFLHQLKELPVSGPGAPAALTFMRDWLVEHILGTDQQFVAWRVRRDRGGA